jgi:hypothetical protein
MPITHKLKRQLHRDILERDLRQDFPDIPVTRGLTGTIKARARFDIVVGFQLSSTRARIFATHPLLYALVFRGGRFGYAEDEKGAFEHKYARWFTERYEDYLVAGKKIIQ